MHAKREFQKLELKKSFVAYFRILCDTFKEMALAPGLQRAHSLTYDKNEIADKWQ